jgi:hypothetical protein
VHTPSPPNREGGGSGWESQPLLNPGLVSMFGAPITGAVLVSGAPHAVWKALGGPRAGYFGLGAAGDCGLVKMRGDCNSIWGYSISR